MTLVKKASSNFICRVYNKIHVETSEQVCFQCFFIIYNVLTFLQRTEHRMLQILLTFLHEVYILWSSLPKPTETTQMLWSYVGYISATSLYHTKHPVHSDETTKSTYHIRVIEVSRARNFAEIPLVLAIVLYNPHHAIPGILNVIPITPNVTVFGYIYIVRLKIEWNTEKQQVIRWVRKHAENCELSVKLS